MLLVGLLTSALALAGVLWTLVATVVVVRFARNARSAPRATPQPVTILKPLHGAEPELSANLDGLLKQDWAAPIQLLTGVATTHDAAVPIVRDLIDRHPTASIDLVINATRHGANAKIGNLINMAPSIAHDIVILSDSDIVVPPDYLTRVVGALEQPGVGAVTCAIYGRGDGGFWSKLAAAASSYHGLPGVLMSVALQTGGVCMGSTIAMRREMLGAIGGFERFADILADDHAIGEAVTALGHRVVVGPVIVGHATAEASLHEVMRHELRWAATIRDLRPASYTGLIITHPLPFALVTLMAMPALGSVALVIAAVIARMLSAFAIDRVVGHRAAPAWLLPLRDLVSFAVFIESFFVRSVDWRGQHLKMVREGRVEEKQGITA